MTDEVASSPTTTPPTGGRRRVLTPRRVVSSVLLAVAAGGIVYAFQASPTDRRPSCVAPNIEQVFPCAGDIDLRQDEIGVDLASGFTGVLFVDGVEIPEDQLQRIEPLGQYFYTPTREGETGELRPGRHCATAEYWPIGGRRERGSQRYTWCFQSH